MAINPQQHRDFNLEARLARMRKPTNRSGGNFGMAMDPQEVRAGRYKASKTNRYGSLNFTFGGDVCAMLNFRHGVRVSVVYDDLGVFIRLDPKGGWTLQRGTHSGKTGVHYLTFAVRDDMPKRIKGDCIETKKVGYEFFEDGILVDYPEPD